jgi:hypothetical protein
MDYMKIFLSYAPSDAAIASKIYDRLRADGFQPWRKDTDLIPGTEWRPAVKKAVESSGAVIVLVSSALTSSVGFMHKETKDALDIADQQPEGAIFVIPLKLEDCKMPDRLSQLAPVNYFEMDGYDRLLQALRVRGEQLKGTLPPVSYPSLDKPSLAETIKTKAASDSNGHSFLGPAVGTPQVPVSNQGRKSFKTFLGLGLLVIFAFGVGWLIRRKVCPPVRVPHSHFVKENGNKKVIIFVHGVLGDVDNTWIDTATRASWPELISSDPAMNNYDVYVYGYKSSCGGDVSDITEIANRMGQQLQDDQFFSKYQEIDFITHSMGGLVTKRIEQSATCSYGTIHCRSVCGCPDSLSCDLVER